MPFTIITDHASLKWLMSLKDLNGRLACWSLKLQIYDFAIEHKKGSENAVAGTLSIDLEPLLGFETTKFESPEYSELREEVLAHGERLSDLVVDGIYLFWRSSETTANQNCWSIPGNCGYRIASQAPI